MTVSRLSAAAGAAALALVLAGCSGSPSAEPTADTGPIQELFENVMGDWNEDDYTAEMRRIEELVAECMAEQGFDYIPVDYSSQVGFSSDDLEVEWGTLEFAELYGYGATTDPWGSLEEQAPGDEWEDPNWPMVEAMSESEQTAYYEALHGPMDFEEGDEVEWEYNWEEAGCHGWAQHEIQGGEDNPWEDDRFAGLQQEMELMWENVQADPRLTEIEAEWAACMADAGYPGFTQVHEAEESIYEASNEVWENASGDLPPDAPEEAWADAEAAAQAELSALTEREIATAVADYTCRAEVDYDAQRRAVELEYEQDFFDTHRTELEEWAATFED